MNAKSPAPQISLARPVAIANWLFVVATMVVIIVMVGGITRLTESGLSITQWNPVTGVLPPLSEQAWQAEYNLYRQTPEFIYEAGPAGMTLSDFKFIFFWEWFHRLIGRLIGIAFALPLAWFWIRGSIPKGYKLRLLALLALGGLQGTFGWLMVRSGLSGTMTDVSHFWLSIHLLTALFTLGGLVWTALDLRALARNAAARPSRLTGVAILAAMVLFLQLLLGAWVAGLNAGHASSDWPLMQGRFIPEYDTTKGLFWAVTHDPFLLHFLHRWWAWVAVAALVWLARCVRKTDRRASKAVHSAFGTQIILGIATVMTGVELWLAVAHQLVGALLVIATAWAMHSAGRRDGTAL
ncbi:Heme A synthase, cytochrome oxidase biogenesis protein Cox15-CtaA [Altererythrobacter epoxidivorans]|uniref:Heme A synthase n=1 Tax=Altererythrobacter epoxidivorans TaxID=361183 RepID=A0A0M4MVN0_9SPHN|nr:COX15/CtaA family protein [Altererythrobacter epoxidivorans]ALE17783.1 Heme A synthase, cytochrome oxidase biogenesis protein Cox15-CtaA [Altererythrobacter epoxidivorans]